MTISGLRIRLRILPLILFWGMCSIGRFYLLFGIIHGLWPVFRAFAQIHLLIFLFLYLLLFVMPVQCRECDLLGRYQGRKRKAQSMLSIGRPWIW